MKREQHIWTSKIQLETNMTTKKETERGFPFSISISHLTLVCPEIFVDTFSVLNPCMPRDSFNTKYPGAKSLPSLANRGLIQKVNNLVFYAKSTITVIAGRFLKKQKQKTKTEKYSTTSSLNNGCPSPSSEVPVSRMPKVHSAKTDWQNQLRVLHNYWTVGMNGLK